MKKILLSLVCLMAMFCCATTFAQATITFDATADKGTDDGNTATATSVTKDGVTLAISNGLMANGQQYRCYKGYTLTVTSTVGNITNIEITCTGSGTSKYGPGCFVARTGSYTYAEKVGTWTGDAAEIVFTASTNQVRMTKVVVTYTSGGVVKKNAGLAFSESEINIESGVDAFTAPTFTQATTAAVTFASDNEGVATVSSDGVISLGSQLGTAVITATSEANDDYNAGTATCTIDVAEYNHYVKATAVESGKAYLIGAVLADGTAFYAYPIGTSNTHGWLYGTTSTSSNDIRVKKSYDDTFVFTNETDGWTIKQNTDSRYLYQSGTYDSFNLAEAPTEGQYWTISANEDGSQTITNKSVSKYIQYSPSYKSFGSYAEAQTNAILPTLYVLSSTSNINAVAAVKADKENAPVYNLAGQRVMGNVKGLFIQNGKKVIRK